MEDITWPRGDTKFIFECWKKISRLSPANEWSNIFQNTFGKYLKIYYIISKIVFCCERGDLLCSHSNGDLFTCENIMLFSLTKMSCFRAKAPLVFHWCLYNKAQFIAKCDRQLLQIASHGLLKIATGTVNRLKELCDEMYQNSNRENCHQRKWSIKITALNTKRGYK